MLLLDDATRGVPVREPAMEMASLALVDLRPTLIGGELGGGREKTKKQTRMEPLESKLFVKYPRFLNRGILNLITYTKKIEKAHTHTHPATSPNIQLPGKCLPVIRRPDGVVCRGT